MGPVIAIIAILAWAAITISKNRSKGGEDATRLVKALADQLDEATEEREKLRKRIEYLEAIVTSDSYELEQDTRVESVSRIDPSLLDAEPLTDEKVAEQLAKRIRER